MPRKNKDPKKTSKIGSGAKKSSKSAIRPSGKLAYKTPGVYIEEISKFPPSVAQVETAIPAFIGYTEKAEDEGRPLRGTPHRISSLAEYERFFGGAALETAITVEIAESASGEYDFDATIDEQERSKYLMYYAMQFFFNNGGGPCWIVSVGGYAALDDPTSPGGSIELSDLQRGLEATRKVDEITLYVLPDAQGLPSAAEYYTVYGGAMDLCEELKDRFTIMDVWQDPSLSPDDWEEHIQTLRNSTSADTAKLKYAAAYYPNIKTTIGLNVGKGEVGEEEVTIVHTGGDGSLEGNLAELKEKNGALYLRACREIGFIGPVLPPSPAMAGIYAAVDNARGVWKAPANVSVGSAIEPVRFITHQEQEGLNIDVATGKSINAIRSFIGRGILVWGARTLAGNDNEWRYISVRRFVNMVEESVKKATEQFVFEPNDNNTWTRVRAMIGNFMLIQWRAGGLAGATPEDAFYVKVGLGETMTALDILEGRMIIEIGMAVVRPAEFILLKFAHKMQTS